MSAELWPKPCVRCGDEVAKPTISPYQDTIQAAARAHEEWTIPMCWPCRKYTIWRRSCCVKRPFQYPKDRILLIDKLEERAGR